MSKVTDIEIREAIEAFSRVHANNILRRLLAERQSTKPDNDPRTATGHDLDAIAGSQLRGRMTDEQFRQIVEIGLMPSIG
jgi:hypothetical protein